MCQYDTLLGIGSITCNMQPVAYVMTQDEIIQSILIKERLEYIRRLDTRVLMCKRFDGVFVVVKFGHSNQQKAFEKSTQALSYLNQFQFTKLRVPEIMSVSKEGDTYSYVVLSYRDLSPFQW